MRQRTHFNSPVNRRNDIVNTPIEYRQKHPWQYPEDNTYEFERWFYDSYMQGDNIGDRIYLPIFWTSYWCMHGYGKNVKRFNNLQLYINALPRNKKYFTICQYDDGPLLDFKDLDIKVFGMGGGRIDYSIPLLCQQHKFKFSSNKKYLFNFIGKITHPIRQKLVDNLTGKDELFYISTKKHSLNDYCKIISESTFTLCPRGYGKSSFRICEAIQYDSIPVYISDDFIIPYEQDEDVFPGLIFIEDLIDYSSLKYIAESRNISMLLGLLENQKTNYTYEGCKRRIIANVNQDKSI